MMRYPYHYPESCRFADVYCFGKSIIVLTDHRAQCSVSDEYLTVVRQFLRICERIVIVLRLTLYNIDDYIPWLFVGWLYSFNVAHNNNYIIIQITILYNTLTI